MPNRHESAYLQGPIYFDFGTNIKMGKDSFANFNFTALDICEITIGENVFIGPNVSLLTPKHPLCWQDRNPYFNKLLRHRKRSQKENRPRTGLA